MLLIPYVLLYDLLFPQSIQSLYVHELHNAFYFEQLHKIPVFHQIRNQFRILCIILQLAVIFHFFGLFYSIRIYLYNTDSMRNHP